VLTGKVDSGLKTMSGIACQLNRRSARQRNDVLESLCTSAIAEVITFV
jgi:hypothetical protein